ncbi:sensor histidine kinase [Salipaludibacillus daqingensis]|uniref:sensor histidine kinase n=1 Tax=Salipaludibacillus daqingensis TaxID=3041001 RepID=UPI002476FC27|nr:sensor histidine kinase [Salipaludibacillus daqingensis]
MFKMNLNWRKWNTLRNQILIIFTIVMTVVLFFVGLITFNLVTDILNKNAEVQIEQTATETLNRVNSQYEQIELITSQIGTDPFVQSLLYKTINQEAVTFNERQSMNQIINSYQAYTTGMSSFELYFTDYTRLFPLNELSLPARIDPHWINVAIEENGRLVWAGEDPFDEDSFVTIKKINLLDRNFSHGGYLITKINKNYFDLRRQYSTSEPSSDFVLLQDQEGHYITSNIPYETLDTIDLTNDGRTVTIEGQEFIRVSRTSTHNQFTLIIYSPVNTLLEGITGIGTAIVIAGGLGFIIFALASYSLSTFITDPIQRLTKAMRFGQLGALKPSPKITSSVELTELNDTYNKMVETTNHLIKVVYEEELTRNRAELKALQAQINPHFLFNTLEALYWSLDEKNEESADIVIAMSELFRYTISDVKGEDWVLLNEEVLHIERYLQIMKLRFGEQLTWSIEIPDNVAEIIIPKLLIQPIVENAILHGIGQKPERGEIKIEAGIYPKNPHYAFISIQDSGIGMDEEALEALVSSMKTRTVSLTSKKGMGIAMSNIQQRMDLSYLDYPDASISIESEIQKGTTVTLVVPIMKGGKQS